MDVKIQETINQLKALALDGDSHENLSAICSVLYQPEFGWTIGACSYLREMLIDWLEMFDPTCWADSYLDEVGLMRLPVDADGEPIHVGDEMDFSEGVRGLTVIGVGTSSINDSDMGAIIRDDDGYTWFNARFLRHHHKPTVEDVLNRFYIDCEDAGGSSSVVKELAAEYADRLREVMREVSE